MRRLEIPLYRGRPLILFPEGWQHGWMDVNKPDPNAALSQQWSLRQWKEFLELYALGIMPCPFGYLASDVNAPWPGVSYAPWGMSTQHSEPRLHPDE